MTVVKSAFLVGLIALIGCLFVVLWNGKSYANSWENDRENSVGNQRYSNAAAVFSCPIPTHHETCYLLYGDKPQSAARSFNQYDPFLLQHIRAHMSGPTPGQPRQLGPGYASRSSGGGKTAGRLRGDVSQAGQSTVVDGLLNGRRNGFFVECVALDGVSSSNSLFFETQRNWTGLLIEGNPQQHRTILTLNRNAFVLRACLGTVRRPMTASMKLAGGLGGLMDTLNAEQLLRLRSKPVAEVNCFPLNSVAAALGVAHIDYLSLDVEGPELEILSTVDWTRLRIDVMTIEYGANQEKLNILRTFFNATRLYREVSNRVEGRRLDVVFQRLSD